MGYFMAIELQMQTWKLLWNNTYLSRPNYYCSFDWIYQESLAWMCAGISIQKLSSVNQKVS